MKLFLSIGCIIALSMMCFHRSNAQDTSFDNAIHFLGNSKPMNSPDVELHFNDPAKRKAAEELYRAQMKAIGQLADCRDASMIPILIGYLNYTNDGNPAEDEMIEPPSYVPDVKTLCSRQPVFALILHLPGASKGLVDYATNSRNQLRLRIAAFHILRYIDQSSFNSVANDFNRAFSTAGPATRARLKAIENGGAPFDGIYPVDITQ